MDFSTSDDHSEPVREFLPFLRIYKDGTVQRLTGTKIVPPSLHDPKSAVQSKDVRYYSSSSAGGDVILRSRIYLPKQTAPGEKLPVLVYYHGGAFLIESAFSPIYHNYLNTLVAEANVIAVSVDYRRAPENPLPIAYEDSWAALEWIASHASGGGSEDWLNKHADFDSVFVAGDSAGANIAHRMAIRFGKEGIGGIGFAGLVLIHPYFWGKDPIGNEEKESEFREGAFEFWKLACPTTTGPDDPLVNPAADPDLGRLGCSKVVVAVAEKDFLSDRGRYYCEAVRKSGWKGEIELLEAKDEQHVFHLMDGGCENAVAMRSKICSFING
ncbi:unnamed protein product [Linum trigynum]|uniref:Alpha/beta hydrolase fold-3 domain-containing protein n=1 Tax=Linum trigynum TaxID=586398 RepID=A0AAV2EV22_9ROSI